MSLLFNMLSRLVIAFLPRSKHLKQFITGIEAHFILYGRSLGQEDPLEKEIATLSSILAWRIPQTEETGRLQSMGSLGVGHD